MLQQDSAAEKAIGHIKSRNKAYMFLGVPAKPLIKDILKSRLAIS